MQSVSITTKVVNSNPTHGEVYLIQHYVIKFVSDLRPFSHFLWVLRFPPPIKLINSSLCSQIYLQFKVLHVKGHIRKRCFML